MTCPADAGICPPNPICTDIICIEPCNQCPCQYVDFVNDLADGDQVKAFLRDTTRNTLYNYSKPISIPYLPID